MLLPYAAYDRDPTVDYDIHKNLLYIMATCHSLRVVDDALIGDPLDIKMFEFTGWSFEEGQRIKVTDESKEGSTFHASVARPPQGMEYDADQSDPSASVGLFPFIMQQTISQTSRLLRQNFKSSRTLSSYLIYGELVS